MPVVLFIFVDNNGQPVRDDDQAILFALHILNTPRFKINHVSLLSYTSILKPQSCFAEFKVGSFERVFKLSGGASPFLSCPA